MVIDTTFKSFNISRETSKEKEATKVAPLNRAVEIENVRKSEKRQTENPTLAIQWMEEIEFLNSEWKYRRDWFYDWVLNPEQRDQVSQLRKVFEQQMEPLTEKINADNLSGDERYRLVQSYLGLHDRYTLKVKKIIGGQNFQELVSEQQSFNEYIRPFLRISAQVYGDW